MNNVGGGLPIVMIFTMDIERGFNMLTVASVIGYTGLELFDTIGEVNELLNGNYAVELCKDHDFGSQLLTTRSIMMGIGCQTT